MADKRAIERHTAKIGPGLFILTLVAITEFFWWFMHA